MTTPAIKPLLPYKPVIAFKPKDAFGQPKPLLNAMQKDPKGNIIDGQKALMGVVFGTARAVGMSVRTANDGEVTRQFCLEGSFEAIPVDRDINPQKAPRAWLPNHIHALVRDALRDNDPANGTLNEHGADAVEFSFTVGIESSTRSTAGFVWDYVPTIDVMTASDPLAHLRATIPAALLPPTAPKVEGQPDAVEGDQGEHDGNVIEPEIPEEPAHEPAKGRRHK